MEDIFINLTPLQNTSCSLKLYLHSDNAPADTGLDPDCMQSLFSRLQLHYHTYHLKPTGNGNLSWSDLARVSTCITNISYLS